MSLRRRRRGEDATTTIVRRSRRGTAAIAFTKGRSSASRQGWRTQTTSRRSGAPTRSFDLKMCMFSYSVRGSTAVLPAALWQLLDRPRWDDDGAARGAAPGPPQPSRDPPATPAPAPKWRNWARHTAGWTAAHTRPMAPQQPLTTGIRAPDRHCPHSWAAQAHLGAQSLPPTTRCSRA